MCPNIRWALYLSALSSFDTSHEPALSIDELTGCVARNGIPPNSQIDVVENTADSALFSLDIDLNRRYDDRKERALLALFLH